MWLRILSLLALCSAFMTSASAQGQAADEQGRIRESGEHSAREHVRFRRMGGPVIFSNFLLKTNESVRDIVVIGGDADIQGIVEGSLVLIGGRLRVSGTIEGETVVVLGGADLEGTARLEGEVVLIGGPFEISPGALLERESNVVSLGDVAQRMERYKQWLFEGLFLGRLLVPGIRWPWTVAAVFAGIYFALLLIFPGAVRGTVRAMEERPVTSIATGLLVLVLFAPLIFLLVISVVGILVVPFLKIALLLLVMFGKTGVLCLAGRRLGRSSGLDFLERLLPAFLVGLLLLTLLYMVPVAGIMVWAVTTAFGLGGAVVALSNSFQGEESPPPARVMLRPPPGGEATTGTPAGAASTAEPPLAGTAGALVPGSMLLPRAGFWSRLVAMTLDLLLIAALTPVAGPFIVIAGVIYFVGMWTWKGTTIGGIVMGLKVVTNQGEPVNFAVALVRSLSSLFSAAVLFLGFLWAGWDREKQSWHDKIAGTIVVRMPRDFALV